MFGGAPSTLDGLTGATAWAQLQQARDDLELAFVLILARASSGAVPCADIAKYNDLVARQVQLEKRGLSELHSANVYAGTTEPGVLPQVTACQTGEQSIWLRPGQAQGALSGALARYRGMRQKQLQARQQTYSPLLGSEASPTLTAAGVVLVGWAAQAVAEYEYKNLGADEVTAQAQEVATYLQSCKAALSPAQVTDATKALEQARGRTGLPFGLSLTQALVLAFVGGLVLASGAWYIWGRKSSSPSLSGSCPRSRRALVMV